jgi:hypothetical protein
LARRPVALRRALVALVAAVALVAVPLARADGDPASDVLYGSNLFPSYDSGISAANLQALQQTLDDSKKAGYEIRVAVIAKPDDLGAVTALWAKPKHYARFLGTELGIVYRGPVLIVMPNGIGFFHADHDTKNAYAALKTIQTGDGNQLAQAAVDSVAALARQAGHPFTPHAASASSSSSPWAPLLVGVGAAAVIVGALVAFLLLWRRRHS